MRFLDPTTIGNDYPCFASASVAGQISGNAVFLQIVGTDGSTVGQIGQATPLPATGLQAVTFNSTGSGHVLQSLAGAGYAVYASGCGGGTLQNPADAGSVCIGINTTTACQPPLTLTPMALSFPAQAVGSAASTLNVILANPNSSILDGITLSLTNSSGQNNFTETDNCGPNGGNSQGQPFALLGNQSCTVKIAFAPKQNCAAGASSKQCLFGTLTVNCSTISTILSVLINGEVTSDAAAPRKLDSRSEKVSFPAVTLESSHNEVTRELASSGRSTFQDLAHHEKSE